MAMLNIQMVNWKLPWNEHEVKKKVDFEVHGAQEARYVQRNL